jgi:DNA-binding protein Fis
MDKGLEWKTDKAFGHATASTGVAENRIEALKALANLMIREVESLEEAPILDVFQDGIEPINLYDAVQRFEIELIRHALIRSRGCQSAAATLLGVKTTTLHSKIKRYGVAPFAAVGKL